MAGFAISPQRGGVTATVLGVVLSSLQSSDSPGNAPADDTEREPNDTCEGDGEETQVQEAPESQNHSSDEQYRRGSHAQDAEDGPHQEVGQSTGKQTAQKTAEGRAHPPTFDEGLPRHTADGCRYHGSGREDPTVGAQLKVFESFREQSVALQRTAAATVHPQPLGSSRSFLPPKRCWT